jgi:hypothetical protein
MLEGMPGPTATWYALKATRRVWPSGETMMLQVPLGQPEPEAETEEIWIGVDCLGARRGVTEEVGAARARAGRPRRRLRNFIVGVLAI